MQAFLLLIFECLFSCGCAVFAYSQGRTGERLGAALFVANTVVGVLASLAGLQSPLAHLVEDGSFALGLLPLAMIFVSYWIGLVTLIAAALFALEAIYLLNEWPADITYVWINNSLWLLVPVVFLISGVVNMRKRRAGHASNVCAASAIG
jgi:hypothetical protein